VAGAGTTTSAPAITVNAGSVNVVALGPTASGSLFYWAKNGSTVWHQDPALPGLDTGAPVITTVPGGADVVDIDFFGRSGVESTVNGTGSWQWNYVTGSLLSGSSCPAATTNAGILNIANI
jgi:hypothetical protein